MVFTKKGDPGSVVLRGKGRFQGIRGTVRVVSSPMSLRETPGGAEIDRVEVTPATIAHYQPPKLVDVKGTGAGSRFLCDVPERKPARALQG